MRFPALLIALAAVCVAAVSCGGIGNAPEPLVAMSGTKGIKRFCGAQTPPPQPIRTIRRSTAAQKQPMRGLVDLGQVPKPASLPTAPPNTLYYVCRRAGAISGITINDTWSDLQPDARGESIRTSTIDAALALVRKYNDSSGASLGVRIRVWAGIAAPAWAKNIGGPIELCDPNEIPPTPAAKTASMPSPTPCPASAIRTVGAFWSVPYERAWRNLQKQLAAKYDSEALLNEIVVSSCSSISTEPFVVPEDSFSRSQFILAHYTDGAYRRCLSEAIGSDYEPFWHLTNVDYSFNPFRAVGETPIATDLRFTERLIGACRTALGNRCVLMNETMAKFTPPPSPTPGQTPSTAQAYYRMWRYMGAQGGIIAYQSAAPPHLLSAWGSNNAGWNAAVRLAHRFGATSLELFPPGGACRVASRAWVSGYVCFSETTLMRWKNVIL